MERLSRGDLVGDEARDGDVSFEGGAGKASRSSDASATLAKFGERSRDLSESRVGSCSENETFFLRFWNRPERRLEPSLSSEDEEFEALRLRDGSSKVGESPYDEDA